MAPPPPAALAALALGAVLVLLASRRRKPATPSTDEAADTLGSLERSSTRGRTSNLVRDRADSGRGTLKSLESLRNATKTIIVARRIGHTWHVPETVFDSPLQQAIHTLQELAEQLEEGGDANAAVMARKAVELLHEKNLLEAPTLQTDDVDENAIGWLQSCDVLPDLAPIKKANSAPQMLRKSGYAKQPAVLNPRLTILPAKEKELLQMLEHGVAHWEFDALKLDELSSGHALSTLGWALCERHGLRQAFGIASETLCNLLLALEAGYRDVPYHSAAHGACVTQGAHWLVTSSDALRGCISSPLDILSLIFGALVHDLNHDGRGNAFHVASCSDLAMLYSDQSVLEMHHLATAFRLLRQKDCNIVAGLNATDAKTFRSTVIGMVLATDLSHNFAIINQFKTMLNVAGGAGAGSAPPRTRSDERHASGREPLFSSRAETITPAERLVALKMVMKCSDIGNVTKGTATALSWTDRVNAEFFAQGDDEAARGLPVVTMNDRKTANVPKQQLGFYNFIVRPMYDAMALLVDMHTQLFNLDEMQQHWGAQVSQEEEARCDIAGSSSRLPV